MPFVVWVSNFLRSHEFLYYIYFCVAEYVKVGGIHTLVKPIFRQNQLFRQKMQLFIFRPPHNNNPNEAYYDPFARLRKCEAHQLLCRQISLMMCYHVFLWPPNHLRVLFVQVSIFCPHYHFLLWRWAHIFRAQMHRTKNCSLSIGR